MAFVILTEVKYTTFTPSGMFVEVKLSPFVDTDNWKITTFATKQEAKSFQAEYFDLEETQVQEISDVIIDAIDKIQSADENSHFEYLDSQDIHFFKHGMITNVDGKAEMHATKISEMPIIEALQYVQQYMLDNFGINSAEHAEFRKEEQDWD